MEIILTEGFLTRVEEYTDYIALDHIPSAIKWAEGVFEHCEQLLKFNRTVAGSIRNFIGQR